MPNTASLEDYSIRGLPWILPTVMFEFLLSFSWQCSCSAVRTLASLTRLPGDVLTAYEYLSQAHTIALVPVPKG